MTKKQPAKKRPHEVTACDSKGQIVPTKATVAVPRPKKRTAGVEVVKVRCWVVLDEFRAVRIVTVTRKREYTERYVRNSDECVRPAILTVHIPKRRSSK